MRRVRGCCHRIREADARCHRTEVEKALESIAAFVPDVHPGGGGLKRTSVVDNRYLVEHAMASRRVSE